MNEMIPAMVSATNRTIEGTGFRIDQAEMLRKFMVRIPYPNTLGARGLAGRDDLVAGVEEGARGRDHRLVAAEAGDDADAIVVDLADPDVAPLDLVVLAEDVDEIALVVAQHRRLRQQGQIGRAAGQRHRGEGARPDLGAIGDRDAGDALAAGRVDDRRKLPDIALDLQGRADRSDRRGRSDADIG